MPRQESRSGNQGAPPCTSASHSKMQGPAVMQSLDFGCLIESTPPDKLGASSLLMLLGGIYSVALHPRRWPASIQLKGFLHEVGLWFCKKIQRHDYLEDTQKHLHVDWRKSCGQIQVDLMLKQVVPHPAPTGDWAGRASLTSRGKKGKPERKKKRNGITSGVLQAAQKKKF